MMEQDEAGTHERLRSGKPDLFEPTIARHKGTIFKLMDDGMLAEFSSVVEPVECAVGSHKSTGDAAQLKCVALERQHLRRGPRCDQPASCRPGCSWPAGAM